jgi:inner membrane protein
MDNLTHSLAGWALGQAGLKRRTRKGLAALILGANMPDIDVFLGSVAWAPLATHRGFTHSIVGGVLVMPPILFGLLWLLDRWQVRRGETFASGLPMRPGWLLGLCYLGAATHPYLDLLTTYSVQLFSPFSAAWYHADALFIIDVWIWLLLGGAIFLSRRLERSGGDWRRPAQIAIAMVIGYIALNLAITRLADAEVRRTSGPLNVDRLFASPPPALFWRRDLVWREGGCDRRASYDPLGRGFGPIAGCTRPNLDDPLVQTAIRREPRLRKFLRWSILPEASVERGRCVARVTIGDARYGKSAQSRLARATLVPTGAPGC